MPNSSKKSADVNKPLVSIITPSLNQGEYIEDTIQSVLSQTYDNIEYIIMDGGSTDNTIDIIRKYEKDNRLKWLSNRDEGQYDAVNRGFTLASGDILGWINADDVYTDDTLVRISSVFQNNHDVEIVYGRAYSFVDQSRIRRKMFCRDFSHKWLRRYCYTNPSVTFIRGSIIKQDRLFIDTSVPTYGDWDWYLRMAEQGKKFYYVPEVLGYFRIHACSRIMMMDQRQIRAERRMISQRHNIPLSYISLWVDHIIPWTERFDNFFFLLKRGKWHEMGTRFINASSVVCNDFWHKLA